MQYEDKQDDSKYHTLSFLYFLPLNTYMSQNKFATRIVTITMTSQIGSNENGERAGREGVGGKRGESFLSLFYSTAGPCLSCHG